MMKLELVSPLLFSVVPSCKVYDPAYAYEIAIIVQDGIRRMYQEKEDAFYYLTVYNENYAHPAMPAIEKLEEGVLRGMYKVRPANGGPAVAQLFGSGSILYAYLLFLCGGIVWIFKIIYLKYALCYQL